mmetsp:Transcript_81168/g.131505  ORF Transcript_81168/g.131505 Transcript_81168/m.131505 type:complete len:181 (-) Transcript_81168:33-575(-)
MPMLKEKCNLLFTLFVVIACTIWWAICMGQTRSMWGVLCMNSHVSSCNMLMSSTTCTVLFLFSSVGYGCLSVGHCAFGVFADMMCVFVFPRFEEDREQRHFEEQMKQIIQMESTTFDPCAVPVEPPALPQAPQTQDGVRRRWRRSSVHKSVHARARTHVCVYKMTVARINTDNFTRVFFY